jgi:hypothetical protein
MVFPVDEKEWNDNVDFLFQTVNYARLHSDPEFLRFGDRRLLYTRNEVHLPGTKVSLPVLKEAVTRLYPSEKTLDKQLLDVFIADCKRKGEVPVIITDQKLPYLELYPWGTIMLELTEGCEKKIDSDAEKGVRQAIKKNVEVIELKSASEWREFLEIGEHLRKRKNLRTPFATAEFFRRCFEEQGFVRLMGAYVGCELVAGGLFFASKKYIRYARGATSYKEYYDFFPTHLILWKMIEWGKRNGCKYFDLGGYHIGAKKGSDLWKINLFKKQWGELVLRRRYVGAFLLNEKLWRLLGGVYKQAEYALNLGVFRTKSKKEFKKCLEKMAEKKVKLEKVKHEVSELLGVSEEHVQSRAAQLYYIWRHVKSSDKKNVRFSLKRIDSSMMEKNHTRIVEQTSKNLKTQDKYLTKTLLRFTREILLALLRQNLADLKRCGDLDIRINSLVDSIEEYDKSLRMIEKLEMRVHSHDREQQQNIINEIRKSARAMNKDRCIEKRNRHLDKLLNVLHENNLYLMIDQQVHLP